MTREEAMMHLEYRKDFATPQQIEAIDMAINALTAIENIKAEIESIEITWQVDWKTACTRTAYQVKNLALEIIGNHTIGKENSDADNN